MDWLSKDRLQRRRAIRTADGQLDLLKNQLVTVNGRDVAFVDNILLVDLDKSVFG